jgi:hypothetical protein
MNNNDLKLEQQPNNKPKDDGLSEAIACTKPNVVRLGGALEDIFGIDVKEDDDSPKIRQSDFNEHVKKLLKNISNSYNDSWHDRRLDDIEFPNQSVCNKCTGCGEFKSINGQILECRQYNSEDDSYCYHRFQDSKEFGEEVESELDSIWGLMGIEIVSDSIEVA